MKAKTVATTRKAPPAIVWSVSLLILGILALFAGQSQARAGTYVVDFTDYHSSLGSVDAWLQSKGFQFERDAKSQDKILLSADGRGLEVEALQRAQGLLINHAIAPNAFSAVEIEWGVRQHPQGASYENKVNNEAIMVHVFFGNEKKPSGGMFAPDLPYFVGLFLCNGGDRVGHAYTGRYYQEGGRYVCLQSAPAGQTFVSHFDIKDGVRSIFGNIAQAVSGYSIEVDTSASAGEGKSSAFIKRIRFLT